MESAKYTHFVPVGHTRETLTASIKESMKNYPVSKVILVLGKNKEDASEKKARKVAEMVQKDLSFISFESIETDARDVISAATDLVIRARREQKAGSMIVFNLSGSLRTLDIAGYIASLLTGSHACVGIPAYDGDKASGIKENASLPEIPVIELSLPKKKVLSLLSNDEWTSLEDLSRKYGAKEKIKEGSKKSKTSFHLTELKMYKLIETEKRKKEVFIRMTGLGGLYYEAIRE